MKTQYDVVVIGGGPAGSSAAATVAESGFDTLLVERESMPRFHVGESLMPETYWPLQRLGLTDRVKASGWQAKKSVQFVSRSGRESEPFFFSQHDDRPCSTTWQVQRSEFDHLLFQRAAELGADCFDQTRLREVHFDDRGKATGVSIRDSSGKDHSIDAQVVMDGSGQQTFLANKLNLKVVDPHLKKVALWTYYRDAVRGQGDNEGATIIMQSENQEVWFWFIPLAQGITSIGCVGDSHSLLKGRGKPEQIFREEQLRCPGLVSRLQDAKPVDDLHVAKEFSYRTRKSAGDGWVLIGDAFGFIDPVYSSGVYFALEMGIRAGDAVAEGLRKGDVSEQQLGCWVEPFNQGSQWVRKLVDAFYTKEFSIGRFMKQHPEHRSNVTDLLIGRVFNEEAGRMFDDLEKSLQSAKSMKS